MDYKFILKNVEDGICLLTLNDPGTLNSLSNTMITELQNIVDEVEEDDSIRVVIFTGEGKAFIAGGDISYMAHLTPQQARKYAADTAIIYQKMLASSKVFIAAVNGFALGGGCEFALACDIRIASDNAKLGLPEVSLGVLPGGGGTQRLPRLVGTQKAMELILTGDIIKAEEAQRIGLVSQVVPREELINYTMDLAKRIKKNAPLAVKYARECVKRSEELTLNAGLEYENTMFGLCFATEDQKEGMSAFLEKRPAQLQSKF